ncbi:TIGR03364 family FAD-dependent oxidoreductase [Epidermidibacterium keratini]|uniref:TIGR03364 family FAD-dependent oxidoreductase n=1 Tax=Epidermidibacterium keratini TaxID=1891644 RepID=A0A7M3T502_9ACTN|nr:TIGR03364 family FAD-dependent oxidoreductase [Epidermidibacterium keratini]QHB98850.1 TIGR03364 family FAD-dependent oxidoreductase [Epidermidibacterium keratini]
MKVVIVGGGALGSMHAWHAVRRGHEVVQVERDLAARSASVRNFGLVWVSGRADGDELTAALRARELWEQVATDVPEIGFRPNGSLSAALTDAELAVAKEVAARPDAAERGFRVVDAEEARRINPALRGDIVGALHCSRDGAVEPRLTQQAIRAALSTSGRYEYVAGTEVVDLGDGYALGDDGRRFDGDLVVYLPGARLGGLTRRMAPELPVRRVFLQMFQTQPLDEQLTTSIADGDSFRYYPAFAGDALQRLESEQPQHPVADENHMQLLMVQRLDGSLTIGDTHTYDEPFPFDVDEAPTAYLTERVEQILGRPLPTIQRRWYGIYAQCHDPRQLVHRESFFERTHFVTGPGGRGMTLSPAIAETTCELFNL